MEAKLLFSVPTPSHFSTVVLRCWKQTERRYFSFDARLLARAQCCEWDFGFRFSFPPVGGGGGKTGERLLSHQQTLIYSCFLFQRRERMALLSTSSQRTTRNARSRWKLWTRFETTLSTSSRRDWIWRSRATMLSRIAWKWRRREFAPDRASRPRKKSRSRQVRADVSLSKSTNF